MKLERLAQILMCMFLVISGCASTSKISFNAFPMRGQSAKQTEIDVSGCRERGEKLPQQPEYVPQFVLPAHDHIQPLSFRIFVSCMAIIDYVLLFQTDEFVDGKELADWQSCQAIANKVPSADEGKSTLIRCLLDRNYTIIGPGNSFHSPSRSP